MLTEINEGSLKSNWSDRTKQLWEDWFQIRVAKGQVNMYNVMAHVICDMTVSWTRSKWLRKTKRNDSDMNNYN